MKTMAVKLMLCLLLYALLFALALEDFSDSEPVNVERSTIFTEDCD